MAADNESPRITMRQARVVFALIGIVVSIFDLGSDWWAFRNFVPEDAGKKTLTICLGVVCGVSTILFFMEVYQGTRAFSVYCRRQKLERGGRAGEEEEGEEHETGRSRQKLEEQQVERLQEIVTFLILLFEDIPSAVILYSTFREGNCRLYNKIFDETLVAYLSLSGIFVSALWKGIQSLFYCVQCCRFYDIKYCEGKAVLCLCRLLRPFVAVVLMMFVSFLIMYVYFEHKFKVIIGDFAFGLEPRVDCVLNGTVSTLEVTTPTR